MLALVITIIIVDTFFRPHLTIMSSTIYMNISVQGRGQEGRNIKRRIERTEGEWQKDDGEEGEILEV
jgi:hypothetical protein